MAFLAMNLVLLAVPAIVLYLAGGLSTALRLFARSDGRQPPRLLGVGFGLVAALLHGVVIFQLTLNQSGLNFSFFNVLTIATWSIVLLLLVSAVTKPVENLAIFVMPASALSVGLALGYPSQNVLSLEAPLGLELHVLVSLLAYSLLAMAALQAILVALQERKLRAHKPGGFVRALPPMQTMERLMFEMITVGFILLTASLILGFHFLEDMFEQRLVHKTALSLISWGVFSVLLWGRFRFGWRGRTAIRWTLAGFGVLVLAYFGTKAVIELILT